MDGVRELKFLQTTSGRVPFDDWYESLKDRQTRRVIAGRLRRLQNAEFTTFKSVGGGVFELRIFYGPGYRVYFAFEGCRVVIVIAGGNKRTQARDIDQAISLWKDYSRAA